MTVLTALVTPRTSTCTVYLVNACRPDTSYDEVVRGRAEDMFTTCPLSDSDTVTIEFRIAFLIATSLGRVQLAMRE